MDLTEATIVGLSNTEDVEVSHEKLHLDSSDTLQITEETVLEQAIAAAKRLVPGTGTEDAISPSNKKQEGQPSFLDVR